MLMQTYSFKMNYIIIFIRALNFTRMSDDDYNTPTAFLLNMSFWRKHGGSCIFIGLAKVKVRDAGEVPKDMLTGWMMVLDQQSLQAAK